jgi:hypothetical protein
LFNASPRPARARLHEASTTVEARLHPNRQGARPSRVTTSTAARRAPDASSKTTRTGWPGQHQRRDRVSPSSGAPTHHARPSAEDRRPQPSDRFRVKRRPERYSRHAAMDEFQPSRLVCVSRVLPAGTRSAAVALCFGLPVRRLRSCRVEAGPLRRPRSLSVTQPGEQNGEQIETKSQYPRNTESLS